MTKKTIISVVVTAHNAEDTIRECLLSIAANKGSAAGEIEIILVDDRSRDNTAAAARSLGLANLIVIPIVKYENREITARQAALDVGFRRSRGEVILVTDADAAVPENWIYSMASPLLKKGFTGNTGMIEFRGKKKWLAKLQTEDAMSYFFLSRLFNRLGLNGGIFFGNFAFKKEVYDKLGGFAAIGFALTEDLTFYRAMRNKDYKVHFSTAAPVSVRAAGSWRELIRRNKRVSSGGFSFLSLFLGLWLISLIVLLILAAGTNPAAKILLAARYFLGVGFAAYASTRTGRFSLLPAALIYEASVIVLGVVTLVSLMLKRKIQWGGVVYDR